MLVMVLADVAFVSAEIVYYDKKTDYSNCCKEEKYFIPKDQVGCPFESFATIKSGSSHRLG